MIDQKEQAQTLPDTAERVKGVHPAQESAPSTKTALASLAMPIWRRLLPHVAVLAAMTIVTIIATWPLFPQLGGYVLDKGDPLYSVWAMAWQDHAIVTDPAHFYDANNMYPFRGTLTFDELSFAEALMAAPVYWLTGNPLL